MPSVEILGVHPIEASEPVHLIEVKVTGLSSSLDFGQFQQELPARPASDWQVAYLEHLLDETGGVVTDLPADLARVEVRAAFFMHYLDLSRPLRTPFGSVPLPPATPLPKRLHLMKYEAP